MTAVVDDEIALRLLFDKDGRAGAHVAAWCTLAANVGRHGWALVQKISHEQTTHGAPAIADGILHTLDKLGLIERGHRETWFAPEIKAFGVGGMPGDRLERADYPCLFYWSPTRRLQKLTHWIATSPEAEVIPYFSAQIYAFAVAHPNA